MDVSRQPRPLRLRRRDDEVALEGRPGRESGQRTDGEPPGERDRDEPQPERPQERRILRREGHQGCRTGDRELGRLEEPARADGARTEPLEVDRPGGDQARQQRDGAGQRPDQGLDLCSLVADGGADHGDRRGEGEAADQPADGAALVGIVDVIGEPLRERDHRRDRDDPADRDGEHRADGFERRDEERRCDRDGQRDRQLPKRHGGAW